MLHAAAVVAIAVAVAAVIAIMHKLNSHANLKKLASGFYANSFAMCVDFGGEDYVLGAPSSLLWSRWLYKAC